MVPRNRPMRPLQREHKRQPALLQRHAELDVKYQALVGQ